MGIRKKDSLKYLVIVDPGTGLAIVLKIAGMDYTPATGSIVVVREDRLVTHNNKTLVAKIGEIPARENPVITLGNAQIISAPVPFRNAIRLARAGTIRPTGDMLNFAEYGGLFFIGTESGNTRDKFLRREEGASL